VVTETFVRAGCAHIVRSLPVAICVDPPVLAYLTGDQPMTSSVSFPRCVARGADSCRLVGGTLAERLLPHPLPVAALAAGRSHMIRSSVRLLILVPGLLVTACSAGPGAGGSTGAAGGWTRTSPSGMAGATLTDAVPFGSGFVVVGAGPDGPAGQAGGVWISADGSTWDAANVDLRSAHVKAVADAGDGLIAAGEHCSGECIGYLLWSTADGKAWSGPIKPPGTDDDVAIGVAGRGPTFVAISGEIVDLAGTNAEDGRAMTSTDGKTWTISPAIDAMRGVRLGGVASGASVFVVVGSLESGSVRTGASWTSADGKSWVRGTDDASFAGAALTSVIAGGPGFVAAGSIGPNGAVWTSTDGATWTHVDDGGAFAGRPLVDIAGTSGALVVVGNDTAGGHAWTSADGSSWHAVGSIPSADSAKFVAVTLGTKSTLIAGKPLAGSAPAGLLWTGPLPG
jgi:hypothetical protein